MDISPPIGVPQISKPWFLNAMWLMKQDITLRWGLWNATDRLLMPFPHQTKRVDFPKFANP